jgi:C4-dicarboxylate-binding protein DctP
MITLRECAEGIIGLPLGGSLGGIMQYASFIFVLMACLVLAPLTARADQIRLRVTLQLPKASHIGANLLQFKEEVERRAEGAVAFEVHDDSKLYKDDQILDAVASGAIEMGITNYNQFSKAVPAIDIIGQPFLLNFDALVRAVTDPDREIRRVLDKAVLEGTGTRVLWWQAYGSSVFFSKSGRDTKRPTQISGQKIRVSGGMPVDLVQQCGGVPLVISASKQHQAAKDGTVDMISTGITGVDSRKLWEVTDTVTRTEHAALEFVVIINEKVWQRLPAQLQTIFVESAKKVERDLRVQMADIEEKAYAFARAKGMKIHGLDPNEVAEWRACSAGLLADYMDEGGELARRLMSAYGKLRMEPCCNSGSSGVFSLR